MTSNASIPVEELQAEVLVDSPNLLWTLTGDDLWDNVIFAVVTVIAGELINDLCSRLVYMQKRIFREVWPSVTYHAQARTALYDNFRRRMFRKRLFRTRTGKKVTWKKYNRTNRNVTQMVLIVLLCVLHFFFGWGSNIAGLPVVRDITFDETSLVRFRSTRESKGRLRLFERPCLTSLVMDIPNTKSTESWSFCSFEHVGWAPSNRTLENMILLLDHDGKSSSNVTLRIIAGLFVNNMTFQRIYEIYVGKHRAEFLDDAVTLRKNFLRNAELTAPVTGLNISFGGAISDGDGEVGEIRVNASMVKDDAGRIVQVTNKEINELRWTRHWLNAIMLGILEFRGQGSGLFEVTGGLTGVTELAVVPFNRKLKVGEYTGTLLPVFIAVIILAAIFVVWFTAFVLLQSPQGMAWEVITAHRRYPADRLLSGEDETRTLKTSQSRSEDTRENYVGYGVPENYDEMVPSDEDVFAAKPCGTKAD